ncbi:MAG: LytTR family DNA-binding domain-containing protein [Bacteroidales bacterium]|nr:LytTR family DNA-binding domain-containing protein [Bacteroidales bacterium]
MIRVLAIDDEPLALMQLRKMIEMTPYFELVAACTNAFEAVQVLQHEQIDALFTDINMPDLSGIDFVRTLSSSQPIVVFTTAYSQYAIEGYKVNAIDYLLKPFGLPEFQQAAAKVKQQYELKQGAQEKVIMPEESRQEVIDERIEGDILFLKVDYRIVRISIESIRYVESQSEYLRLYMSDGLSHMVLMSITRMAELLPSDRFVRIHRSFIVNMSHVQEIARQRIKMDAETYLPIGDHYKEAVTAFVNHRLVGK